MRKNKKLKIVAVVGPTASGKSTLAVELAKQFNGVIISADSRQVYRGMDIGTAKISKDEMEGISHYMLDVADPDDDFNVSLYQKSVMNLLEAIKNKNRKTNRPVLPFIVGGTGLYVSAIVDGLKFSEVKPNLKLRADLNKKPLTQLAIKLKKLDPNTTTDLKNKRRVIRAIEILKAGSKPSGPEATKDQWPAKTEPKFEVLKIGVGKDRNISKKRIENRIWNMDIPKLIKETKALIKRKYDFSSPALSALGYNDVKDFINDKITEPELIYRLIKLHTQYAKRQMTWFKKDRSIHWVKDASSAKKLIAKWLE
ncbi:tRNA (adenosine(37)-N6)-dimethylallyltransferase MiaA [candidate division Kazan bacterium]|uniref:tRNA dimethylallyltransferase n=1 Tax=candidate division Kazan bacterium TaxID=2202143 RepID=A0A420ZD93_UNCK3|nr:MAG: tRNA (adenosine(37)-N6)-dimethylallyltransferase MiaA [candidate division Kazan bacterium]